MDRDFLKARSKRIEVLRTIAILGVVLLHVPPLVTDPPLQHTYSSAFLLDIKYLMSNVIFMASVPTLSVILGYLLFSTFEASRYLPTVRKKTKSLIVPLILWNLPLLALLYVAKAEGWSVYRHMPEPASAWDVVNLTIGIVGVPLNYPLHFLLDVFICVLLSPLIHLALRHAPFVGLAVCLALLFVDDGNSFVARGDILAAFYMGGLVAKKGWTLATIDRHWRAIVALFLLLCVGYTAIEAASGFHGGAFHDYGRKVLRLAGPFAFWGVFAYLLRFSWSDGMAAFARNTFFIFCAHAPIFKLLWRLYREAGGTVESPLYWLFYVTSPLATVALSVAALSLFGMFAPSLLQILAVPPKPRHVVQAADR